MADNPDMAKSTVLPAVLLDEGRADGGSDSGENDKTIPLNRSESEDFHCSQNIPRPPPDAALVSRKWPADQTGPDGLGEAKDDPEDTSVATMGQWSEPPRYSEIPFTSDRNNVTRLDVNVDASGMAYDLRSRKVGRQTVILTASQDALQAHTNGNGRVRDASVGRSTALD